MIGAMIYILVLGSMGITGALYLGYIAYRIIKQLRQDRYTRQAFEPTEECQIVEVGSWRTT